MILIFQNIRCAKRFGKTAREKDLTMIRELLDYYQSLSEAFIDKTFKNIDDINHLSMIDVNIRYCHIVLETVRGEI